MSWLMVSEMSVRDARPCFLWDCDEEVHCGSGSGTWKGGCLRATKKQIEVGTRICISSIERSYKDSAPLHGEPQLLTLAPSGATGQLFSKWVPGAYLSQP